jgi:hypothetical protein
MATCFLNLSNDGSWSGSITGLHTLGTANCDFLTIQHVACHYIMVTVFKSYNNADMKKASKANIRKAEILW